MSQVQIPNSDHCIWRAQINHLCKSGLEPINCKSSLLFHINKHKQVLGRWSRQLFLNFERVLTLPSTASGPHLKNFGVQDWYSILSPVLPGPNTTGLLETLFIYIFSRLAQASVQVLYNVSSSPVVSGPGSTQLKAYYQHIIGLYRSGIRDKISYWSCLNV